jgi:excisionase family DNA binding protein
MGELLTLQEAALFIRCSKTHLLNVLHGRVPNVPPLPCVRIGRRILVRREAIQRWLLTVESPLETVA